MKKASKKERVLTALLDAGTKGLSKLEVATPCHGYEMQYFSGRFWSSCLNSDISELDKLGIAIDRRNEPYTNEDGTRTLFKRYWLRDYAEAWRVVQLIDQYRLQRKAPPISVELVSMVVNQFPPAIVLTD